jgi:hypothetical protein
MARKTNTDPFDFSKARGSSGRTAFRTPMTGGVSRQVLRHAEAWQKANDWGYVDSKGRMFSEASVSPFKVLAMFFARAARAGIQGAGEFAALNKVASRSATAARRLGAAERQAGFGLKEAQSMLLDAKVGNPMGYSSKLFPDGVRNLFRPGEIEAIYNAFGKIQGRMGSNLIGVAPTLLRNGEPAAKIGKAINTAITSGRILKGGIKK